MSFSRPPLISRNLDLGERASADLSFIRETMDRASAFAAVPGLGWIIMGGTALVTALAATRTGSTAEWLALWVVAAGLSATIGTSFLVHKARRVGQSLESRVGRRFFGTLVPPLVAGAALTAVFVDAGLEARLPGLWLLSYGVAVTGTGNISLKLVTWAGVVFMALGLGSLAAPAAWGDLWMALGFGGTHVVFGWQIARRHDG